MYREILNELLDVDQSSKDTLCISILLPLEQTLPQREKNPLMVKNAINQVTDQLLSQRDDHLVRSLITQLEEICYKLDFKKTKKGLGIFVAPGISKVINFPFSIREKLVIDHSFEIRDLVYASQYQTRYWVLNLNTKNIRLFRGDSDELDEILDDKFPIEYQEQYQYPPGSMPGDYQSEESQIKEERRRQFLRHVNKIAEAYFSKDQIPIVLTGVKDIHATFNPIFNYKNRIVTRIYGDFHTLSAGQLAGKVWPEVQLSLFAVKDQIIAQIQESVGKRGYLYGIEAVWRVASEGRADLLVVEKDYMVPAFTQAQTGKIYFTPSDTSGFSKKVDAVDDVIELIWKKKGEIVFVANGKLDNYDHIAVRTRY